MAPGRHGSAPIPGDPKRVGSRRQSAGAVSDLGDAAVLGSHRRSPKPTGIWSHAGIAGTTPELALEDPPGGDELERNVAPGAGWDDLQDFGQSRESSALWIGGRESRSPQRFSPGPGTF